MNAQVKCFSEWKGEVWEKNVSSKLWESMFAQYTASIVSLKHSSHRRWQWRKLDYYCYEANMRRLRRTSGNRTVMFHQSQPIGDPTPNMPAVPRMVNHCALKKCQIDLTFRTTPLHSSSSKCTTRYGYYCHFRGSMNSFNLSARSWLLFTFSS